MAFKINRGRIWRRFKRTVLFLFFSSFFYLLMCKWVMPPITLTQLGAWMSGDGLKRDYVSGDAISVNLKLAAIASEDQLFPLHSGFDWKSIEKSLSVDPKRKNRVRGSGSSSISQQVAKNVFLWQGESKLSRGVRKIPEFYFTKLIEWIWGKQRILEVYLNVIEMGRGIYGAEAASKTYFNKSAKALSPKEAAMIIACLPNPKVFTVKPVSRRVAWRSNQIIRQMNNLRGDDDIQTVIK